MKITERKGSETARKYAIRVIKEKIISLELEPDSLISEQEIASELNVSRTPIREAFINLSKTKIIKIIPQKGSYISKIDYKMVDEARFIRLQLETGVVEILCKNPELINLVELKENLKLQEFYIDYGDTNKFFEMDNEFHKLLFVMAKKTQAYELMETMQIHFDRVRRMKLETTKEALELLKDHEELLHAIQTKNTEEAIHLIHLHLSRYKIDKDYLQKKYCCYFESV